MAAPRGSFDGLAAGYDFLASLDTERNDFILSNLPAGRSRALDVGCGSGRLAAALAERYERVVGIDVSEDMLAIARRDRPLSNVDYVAMDANDIRLGDSFDLICSINTFHHLEDVPGTLARLKELLSPGGRIVVGDCVLIAYAWLNPFASKHPWVYFGGALLELPGRVRTYGLRTALRVSRFVASRAMRQHLADDQFLTPDAFRSVYGAALPGCTFHHPAGGGMAVIWDAPR